MDGSKYYIFFKNFIWHIVIETMHIFSETLKGPKGQSCGAYLIPNIEREYLPRRFNVTFKIIKGQTRNLLWSVGLWYYNSSSCGPLRTIIIIYVPGYIWQRCWLLVTIDTIMAFDTNGLSYDKIAMGKIMASSVPQPKKNQMAKTTNTELFPMEPPYLIDAAQP